LWSKFRKYHYLDTSLAKASKTFCAEIDGRAIGFIAILHQPNAYSKIKRVHRLVVLPNFQGIGIGTKLLEKVAKYYTNHKYKFTIITSNPALNHSLDSKENWSLVSKGRSSQRNSNENMPGFKRSVREHSKRNKVSWEYCPK